MPNHCLFLGARLQLEYPATLEREDISAASASDIPVVCTLLNYQVPVLVNEGSDIQLQAIYRRVCRMR